VIYEPVMAVAVPKCSVCALPTRHMRHPVTLTTLLSVWVTLTLRVAALTLLPFCDSLLMMMMDSYSFEAM
jgi:hypothetical protein